MAVQGERGAKLPRVQAHAVVARRPLTVAEAGASGDGGGTAVIINGCHENIMKFVYNFKFWQGFYGTMILLGVLNYFEDKGLCIKSGSVNQN